MRNRGRSGITRVTEGRGTKGSSAYQVAYWSAFDKFFGPHNGPVIKAMLLAKYPPGEAGHSEMERVAYGLRHSMGWVAEAIERSASGASSDPRVVEEPEEGTVPRQGR